MKRKNEQSISEAIKEFIKAHGMQERVLESMAIDAWHSQMGKYIENFTEELYVRNQVLYVRLNSPTLKNDLSYGKSKIIAHINETLAEDFIKDVRFL